MPTYNVRTMEKWSRLSAWILDNGFKPWQYQYSWYDPQGAHVWFYKAGYEDVEIVTHSKEIFDAIMEHRAT